MLQKEEEIKATLKKNIKYAQLSPTKKEKHLHLLQNIIEKKKIQTTLQQ